MPYLLVRHKITDYQHWKSAFDQHGATRKASGSKRGVLLRNIQDPNELVIIVEFEDLSQARQFAHSDDLQKKMREAGVIDQPNIYFLEEIEDIPVLSRNLLQCSYAIKASTCTFTGECPRVS